MQIAESDARELGVADLEVELAYRLLHLVIVSRGVLTKWQWH